MDLWTNREPDVRALLESSCKFPCALEVRNFSGPTIVGENNTVLKCNNGDAAESLLETGTVPAKDVELGGEHLNTSHLVLVHDAITFKRSDFTTLTLFLEERNYVETRGSG